jgi:hypothetical protein
VLESTSVTDASGNTVDLTALGAEPLDDETADLDEE